MSQKANAFQPSRSPPSTDTQDEPGDVVCEPNPTSPPLHQTVPTTLPQILIPQCAGPPSPQRPRANASSSGSQTEAPDQPARRPVSNISSVDVKKWMKTGSFGQQNGEGIPFRSRAGQEKARGKEAAIEEEDGEGKGKDQEGDEGEKEDGGGHEPCYNCKGKVVWTRGRTLSLKCEECGCAQ